MATNRTCPEENHVEDSSSLVLRTRQGDGLSSLCLNACRSLPLAAHNALAKYSKDVGDRRYGKLFLRVARRRNRR